MKYNEEQILKQVIEYIESTYNEHYSTDGKEIITITVAEEEKEQESEEEPDCE